MVFSRLWYILVDDSMDGRILYNMACYGLVCFGRIEYDTILSMVCFGRIWQGMVCFGISAGSALFFTQLLSLTVLAYY